MGIAVDLLFSRLYNSGYQGRIAPDTEMPRSVFSTERGRPLEAYDSDDHVHRITRHERQGYSSRRPSHHAEPWALEADGPGVLHRPELEPSLCPLDGRRRHGLHLCRLLA